MADEYRFELLTLSADELERVSALLRTVFPKAKHLTPRYLDWQHRQNPDGEAVGCNAYLGRALVGHMAAMPLTGRIEGEERRGLFMVNGAVDAAHRGRRLQSRISAAIFEESVRRGYSFCFGTGNKWSTGPLLTRFQMVKPLDARIGFGWPRRRDRPVRPSFERSWSEDALRWRLANPEGRYSVTRRGEAIAIASATWLPGVSAILHQGPGRGGVPAGGAAPGPVRVWLGLDPQIDWGASAFLPVPRRLRPSPLNLVYKDLTGGGFVPDPERVVFQGLDFDPF
ncbi:MAG TPA: GNAT family N-acetyltransferase [Allosphingosinicella sp.]